MAINYELANKSLNLKKRTYLLLLLFKNKMAICQITKMIVELAIRKCNAISFLSNISARLWLICTYFTNFVS